MTPEDRDTLIEVLEFDRETAWCRMQLPDIHDTNKAEIAYHHYGDQIKKLRSMSEDELATLTVQQFLGYEEK